MPARRAGRHRLRFPRGMLWLLLGVALIGTVAPAEEPSPPRYYAIRGARLVTVSGPVIEDGTIVLANGLIAAVGTDVTIPAEAWVIEGKGLAVYPGLIDSLTTLGLEKEERDRGAPEEQPVAAQPRGPISQGPEDRPATTSWVNAADNVSAEDRRIKSWREAGFTAAVTAPDEGIVPGQAALINLAGEPNVMVVKTPVALRLNLTRPQGLRGFPSSLMGIVAYIKQLFLDAEQYQQAAGIYSNNPRGLERPAYDRSLEPVARAAAERWPVLLPAIWAKEIQRAVSLGEELGAGTLLYGAHQGYESAGWLAERDVPVLVSVKWPEKLRDADPEADEPLLLLRLRDQAPSTPGAFEKAGVRFAFYSDGLGNPKDILKNIRSAVDAGLSREAAVRALTLGAAEIYGVSDRLGSLEEGKIANLTVTEGDLLDAKTKVKMVFIDGRKYELREPSRPQAPPAVDVSGTWALTVDTRQGPQERTLQLTMTKDGSLTGTVTSERGTSSLSSGWVSGAKFSFTVIVSRGGRTFEATYIGTVEGNTMSGTVTLGTTTADFTGARPEKTGGTGARGEE